jgi:hypothetical protein
VEISVLLAIFELRQSSRSSLPAMGREYSLAVVGGATGSSRPTPAGGGAGMTPGKRPFIIGPLRRPNLASIA